MRVVVISHTYIVRLNRRKLQCIARHNKDTEIAIIVPRKWKPGGVHAETITSESQVDEGVHIHAMNNTAQQNQAMLFFGGELIQFLRKFRPHIIQVEQGAKSVAYAQTISINKLFKLNAKNVFFTWWNLPYNNSFPASLLETFNLANTDGLISGNTDGLEILREHGYKGPAIVSPQLGVDETTFSPTGASARSELGFTPDDFVIGFAGRFVQEKGLATLASAFEQLTKSPDPIRKHAKLLLIGRGPLRNEIAQRAFEAGYADAVLFKENVAHDLMPNYFRAMDVLVLPSEYLPKQFTLTARGWKEQFGHVLIEAMACQVPVIGSDSGEIPTVINQSGITFPAGDARKLAEALKLLYESEEYRANLAHQGRLRVLNCFTDDVLAKVQYDFWCKLLGKS